MAFSTKIKKNHDELLFLFVFNIVWKIAKATSQPYVAIYLVVVSSVISTAGQCATCCWITYDGAGSGVNIADLRVHLAAVDYVEETEYLWVSARKR